MGVVLMFAIPFGAGFATRYFSREDVKLKAYAIGLAAILSLAALLLAVSTGFVGAPILIFPVFAVMFLGGAGLAGEIKKMSKP
jgi:ACR3 family arsenite efflux pump ArsB